MSKFSLHERHETRDKKPLSLKKGAPGPEITHVNGNCS